MVGADETSPRTIVAIPARDEADHIEACLGALAAQRSSRGARLPQSAFEVLVLVNNTRDDTVAQIDRWRRRHPLPVEVREVELPGGGHAGAARKAAMDWADQRLGSGAGAGGVICTTDADSEVDPDWMLQTWRAFDAGADAVAGVVEFGPGRVIDLGLSPSRRLEARYATIQAQVTARFDPEPHNPWPNHLWAWGASLAVRANAYRAIGGLPPAPLAEDRALVAELKRRDFKVRHALDVRVRTSSRAVGRAPGGLADLIRLYSEGDATPCDAELEPIADAARRAVMRRRLRLARDRIAGSSRMRLGRMVEVGRERFEAAMREPDFGAAWRSLEEASPNLRRRRLHPCELAQQIARGERMLRIATGAPTDGDSERGRRPSAGLWCDALEQA